MSLKCCLSSSFLLSCLLFPPSRFLKAYNAFANRVASLKRKLDLLKPTLPGAEDSPIPSPSEDAPSPTGSDSPFMGLAANNAKVDPELDGKAMDDGEMNSDNRDMEDMDVSDEEAAGQWRFCSLHSLLVCSQTDGSNGSCEFL